MNVELGQRDRTAHLVQFYSDEDELRDSVCRFLAGGFRRGETGVVIATPAHRAWLLETAGFFGEIRSFDAAETLKGFMVDGRPDPDCFDDVVGSVVRSMADQGGRARAFGEMVAILWDEGNVTGALELEELWNRLLDSVGFSLLCAYPTSILADDQGTPLAEVCSLHSEIVGARAPRMTDHATASLELPCSVEAPRRARRFVSNMLSHWGLGRLLQDARLVVSELTTNAIKYGKGAFTVTISCQPGAVRIEVEDGSADRPIPIAASKSAVNGRGLFLVDAVATRWGANAIGEGKVVWAELRDLRAIPDKETLSRR